jgi:hypothetical protein
VQNNIKRSEKSLSLKEGSFWDHLYKDENAEQQEASAGLLVEVDVLQVGFEILC